MSEHKVIEWGTKWSKQTTEGSYPLRVAFEVVAAGVLLLVAEQQFDHLRSLRVTRQRNVTTTSQVRSASFSDSKAVRTSLRLLFLPTALSPWNTEPSLM